ELGEHGGVVFTVEHEGVASGTHTPFDVGHWAYGGPIFAEFIDSDMVFQTLPDVIGGHALTDDVGVVGRDVEKTAGAEAVIVNEGDIADGRAQIGRASCRERV